MVDNTDDLEFEDSTDENPEPENTTLEVTNDGVQLTAFRLRDRLYRAGMQKVPRFRFKEGKDGEEDQYSLDLFLRVVVGPDDMKDSPHFSHCFRPSMFAKLGEGMESVTVSVGGVTAEINEENRHRLVIPATGDKVMVNCIEAFFTFDLQDMVTGETHRLQCADGVILREIYPNKQDSPVADVVIEARGCPYYLGDRDWMRHHYLVALVHTSEPGGLFEGQNHHKRMAQTPDRIINQSNGEDDDDDIAINVEPTPLDEAVKTSDDPMMDAHNAEFARLWSFGERLGMIEDCAKFAGLDEPNQPASKAMFDKEVDERGYLDLVVLAEGFTPTDLLKHAQRATNKINKFNWRLLAYAIEHGLHKEHAGE